MSKPKADEAAYQKGLNEEIAEPSHRVKLMAKWMERQKIPADQRHTRIVEMLVLDDIEHAFSSPAMRDFTDRIRRGDKRGAVALLLREEGHWLPEKHAKMLVDSSAQALAGGKLKVTPVDKSQVQRGKRYLVRYRDTLFVAKAWEEYDLVIRKQRGHRKYKGEFYFFGPDDISKVSVKNVDEVFLLEMEGVQEHFDIDEMEEEDSE